MSAQVYVGLGGNIGDTVLFLNKAVEEIEKLHGVSDLRCSNFYQTTPVGPIEQDNYVNAVCGFKTSLSIKEIHKELRRIETELGKVPKAKFHPRMIDLDLLFFGEERCYDDELHVPHPSWNDRMFVLVPLSELVTEVFVPETEDGEESCKVNILDLLETFPNRHNETVTFLSKPMNEKVHA